MTSSTDETGVVEVISMNNVEPLDIRDVLEITVDVELLFGLRALSRLASSLASSTDEIGDVMEPFDVK